PAGSATRPGAAGARAARSQPAETGRARGVAASASGVAHPPRSGRCPHVLARSAGRAARLPARRQRVRAQADRLRRVSRVRPRDARPLDPPERPASHLLALTPLVTRHAGSPAVYAPGRLDSALRAL